MTITITKTDETILTFNNIISCEETETFLIFSYKKDNEPILHITRLDEIEEYQVK